MAIDETESKQEEFNSVLSVLSDYTPKDEKYTEAKNKLLDNAKTFYEGREKIIINCFKNGIFPLNYDDVVEQARYEEKHQKREWSC